MKKRIVQEELFGVLSQIKDRKLGRLVHDSFLIMEVDDGKNYYVQFGFDADRKRVYAEAVGNSYLAKRNRLGDEQIVKLLKLGWQLPPIGSGNFHRNFDVGNDESLREISNLAIDTLRIVYGFDDGKKLRVETGW